MNTLPLRLSSKHRSLLTSLIPLVGWIGCVSVLIFLEIPPLYAQDNPDPLGPEEPLEPLGPDSIDPLGPEILDNQPSKTQSKKKTPSKKKAKKESLKRSKTKLKTVSQDQVDPTVDQSGAWILKPVNILGKTEKISRVSGSAHQVKAKELEEQEYDDVHRVLKQVPGVYVRDEEGHGLRPNIGLRGANSDRSAKVTLLEDGVLMAPGPYSAPAAYYFPLTTRLVGVEVFKGPASIQYGPNTLGGAVNLVTRAVPISGHTFGLDTSYGQFESIKAHTYYGYGWSRFGFLVEGARLQTDGFKELDNGGNTGFEKNELMLKLRANNNPNSDLFHQVLLKVGYADERSFETYLGLTQADFNLNPYRRYSASQMGEMDWYRTQIKADYQLSIGDDFDLKLVAYRHDFSRSWEKLNGLASGLGIEEVLAQPQNPRYQTAYDLLTGEFTPIGDANDYLLIGNNDRSYISQGLQLTGEWRLKKKTWANALRFGVRVHQDEIQRNHTEREFEMNEGVLTEKSSDQLLRKNQGTTSALSVFLFDQLQLGQNLRLTPGIRLETFNTQLIDTTFDRTQVDGEEFILLPGFGLWYSLSETVGLLAGVHRGFSPLTLGADPSTEPETSLNYEAGIRWSHPWVSGEVIGFLNQYNQLVGTCTQSAGCLAVDLDQQFNAGQAQVYGTEVVLNSEIAFASSFKAQAALTYTWTHGTFSSAFQSGFAQWGDVEAGDFLPYVPEHQASLRLNLNWHDFQWGVVGSYVGQMRDVASQNTESTSDQLLIPSQTLVDLQLGYHLSSRSKVYFTIDNVLNQTYITSYRPFGARPSKPFLMRLGYKYQF